MITVTISINGNPIMARSAVNTGETCIAGRGRTEKVTKYAVDDGGYVYHNPDDGAVPLAIQLLETIKEYKK